MKRREFVKNSGRWLILGGFGLIAGYLTINGQVAKVSECKVSTVCKSCNRFPACSLPQAEKQRENGK